MGELYDVLKSISDHTSVEIRDHYVNPSIGRGVLMMNRMQAPRTIWIVNNDLAPSHGIARNITGDAVTTYDTGLRHSYSESGTTAVPKNREFARILLQNYEGHHSCVFENGVRQEFLIKGSAKYTNTGSYVADIHVGLPGHKDWSIFQNLEQALASLDKVEVTIQEKQQAKEEADKRVEELRKQRLEAEAKKAEEEARKLNEEVEAAQAEREAIISEARKASEFIRKQVSLKRNPILDKNQDSAKFSNLYNGVAEVINGGPGTGKTTTMIQRLKLLIDRKDLEDYINNHDDCKLTKSQLDIISQTTDNWIYFSPNDLLKTYLRDNMDYEGLTGTSHRTAVWKDFLKDAVRDHYHLAGQDCPFDFIGKKSESRSIFTGNQISVIENFTKYFLEQVKERFKKISKINYNQFEWKLLGHIITTECAKIDTVDSIDSLLKFLIHLEGIDKGLKNDGVSIESGASITSRFNNQIRSLSNRYLVLLKRDEIKYNEALDFIKSIASVSQPEVDEDEEAEEVEPDYGDLSIALFNKLNPLLRKLSLQYKDSNTRLTTQQKQLFEIVKDVIVEDDLKALTDAAYFVRYMNPALRGFTQYVLTPIPQYYRQYRRSMPDTDKADWDNELLTEMVETYKNKRLLSQEQSLLIGFINNIALSLYRINKQKFNEANHKYIVAYKALCRPVIGVDEATDYSLIEFYGIKSFGHYEVCSYTLCGDIMQLMKDDGIKDWNQLRHPLLFEKLEIKDLLISYRQSKELMNLADLIYQEELGKKSPYDCYIGDEETPKPLWFESVDVDEKAEWISERVIEIVTVYKCVPTIAIFSINKQKAEELKESLEECDNLIKAGIEVKVCSDNTLEGEKTLRIFPIDQVKGMEFEAVFFYDIDDIESTSLINKYIYVGLSRASMYLGVTSNGNSERITNLLQKYFTVGAKW